MTNGMDLPDSDWGDFSCRRAVDSASFIMWSRTTSYNLHGNGIHVILHLVQFISFESTKICRHYYHSEMIMHVTSLATLFLSSTCLPTNGTIESISVMFKCDFWEIHSPIRNVCSSIQPIS